jgi:hypothetical protein
MGAVECRLPMATVVCRGEGKSTKSSKRKLAVVSHSTSEALTQINLASLHIVVCMRYNGCSCVSVNFIETVLDLMLTALIRRSAKSKTAKAYSIH